MLRSVRSSSVWRVCLAGLLCAASCVNEVPAPSSLLDEGLPPWDGPRPDVAHVEGGATDLAIPDLGPIPDRRVPGWQRVPITQDTNLAGVWGSGADDLWAVGAGGTILRYDGAAWSKTASPTTEELTGVWGSSAAAAWIVGSHGTLLRYDSGAAQWLAGAVGLAARR